MQIKMLLLLLSSLFEMGLGFLSFGEKCKDFVVFLFYFGEPYGFVL